MIKERKVSLEKSVICQTKDIRSSQKTYDILRDGIIGKMSLKSTGEESMNLMQLQSQQKIILELFQCEDIVEKNYLKSIGVNY